MRFVTESGMSEQMKQWQLERLGRDHLRFADAQKPAPGPHEVLVRVGAVSLNYRDKLVIDSGFGIDLKLPFVPLSDMAGTVEAVGSEVSRFRVGARVVSTYVVGWIDGIGPEKPSAYVPALGGILPGVAAEYRVLHEDWLVAAPRSLSDVEASTLPIAALTAWFALIENGGLRAGQTVVVQGTGGVALFAVQFAAAHGARVIVTSSTDEKLAKVKKLGASHGINRRTTPRWSETVLDLTNGRGANHVLDVAGGDLTESITALTAGGRIAMIGLLESNQLTAPAVPIFTRRAILQGLFVGHRRALEDMTRAIDALELKPVIDSEHSFAELPAALKRLDAGPFGKIVLRVS
jgi:NADPH:quinone reductase-like Zn-dependent oxidoreductase